MIDSAKLAGQPPIADSTAVQAKPPTAPLTCKGPVMAQDSVTVQANKGGVPALSFAGETPPSEEPNRKAGVTFKTMLKSADDAAKKGFTDQATPLYDRAIALADDAGDLSKIIKAADEQAHMPVVKRALAKGLAVSTKMCDLQDLAKLADKRGLRPETEALVSKAIRGTNNAKDLRKLAEFASDHKLDAHARQIYMKISILPAGK
jgi:hypothetical protein